MNSRGEGPVELKSVTRLGSSTALPSEKTVPMSHDSGQSPPSSKLPRTAIILCRVLELEIEHFANGSDHVVHIERLEQGLHNEPKKLNEAVQAAVDRIERDTDAEVITLGYGLCSRGTEGIRATRCRLVLPRAHDCITLLLGDRHRYTEYVGKHPGTYWYSPGWNKHHLPPGPGRHQALYDEYCQKYGKDNADYLIETEKQWHANYSRATYIDIGLGATDADVQFTRDCAAWLGWSFDRQAGDPDLIKALVFGPWDSDRFVVVAPGKTIRMTGDDQVAEESD